MKGGKMKDDYLDTSLQFYKEDLKAARENDKKSLLFLKVQLIQGLKKQNFRKNKIQKEGIFDTKDIKDEKFILDLIEKTELSKEEIFIMRNILMKK